MTQKEYALVVANNLRRIAYDAGKTQADISRDLKINKATVSSWMNGTRLPRMKKIDLLCHYFNVSRAEIMEKEEDRRQKEDVSPDYLELLEIAKDSKPEYIKSAVVLLKTLNRNA